MLTRVERLRMRFGFGIDSGLGLVLREGNLLLSPVTGKHCSLFHLKCSTVLFTLDLGLRSELGLGLGSGSLVLL